jgi:MFS family permease
LETTTNRLEPAVVSRLMWRLMPFLFLLYIIAYLDRINMSFAVLQMRGQLGLNDRVIGRALGMFFIGYFFFQLPSNLILEKFGVRRWISAIMVTWGVVSCLMIYIRGPMSLYIMRFLLGAAEAGFFPGEPSCWSLRESDFWCLARASRRRAIGLAVDVSDRRIARHHFRSSCVLDPLRPPQRSRLAQER